ncbi:MAG TPA: hypothetical protein VMH00_11625 [Candidatus Limnocylindrales bacterium]|nr:hypothetical protein [Candidatus Limnocylindrales bacterium]
MQHIDPAEHDADFLLLSPRNGNVPPTVETFRSLIGAAVTIALTILVIRWVSDAKPSQVPEPSGNSNIYRVKWQLQVLCSTGGAFWIVVCVWSWSDEHHPDWTILVISLIFWIIGLWLATGLVTTNEAGIQKRSLWRSRFLRWGDITEVVIHKKQGGAIEVRAGSKKLIVDSRFNAFQHLLKEIQQRTGKRAIAVS